MIASVSSCARESAAGSATGSVVGAGAAVVAAAVVVVAASAAAEELAEELAAEPEEEPGAEVAPRMLAVPRRASTRDTMRESRGRSWRSGAGRESSMMGGFYVPARTQEAIETRVSV